MTAGDIETPRLLLRLMPPAAIAACRAGDLAAASAALGAMVPPEVAAQRSGMGFSLRALAADAGYAPWSSRALVLRERMEMVGHLRFHAAPGAPHAFAPGGVELGYGVFQAWRRQGLAREAVMGAMRWAQETAGVDRFVVSVAPGNAASLALAASLGFVQVGEQIDEIDGRELVLLRAARGV